MTYKNENGILMCKAFYYEPCEDETPNSLRVWMEGCDLLLSPEEIDSSFDYIEHKKTVSYSSVCTAIGQWKVKRYK